MSMTSLPGFVKKILGRMGRNIFLGKILFLFSYGGYSWFSHVVIHYVVFFETLIQKAIVYLGIGFASIFVTALSILPNGNRAQKLDSSGQCLDQGACNYGRSGPCVFCAKGQTCNINTGVCESVVSGCTDPNACNYNPSANDDDGSCTYPDECVRDGKSCGKFLSCGQCPSPPREICDGQDNDCDGLIDEAPPSASGGLCPEILYYCDGDGDGFFSAQPSGSCGTYQCVPSGCSEVAGFDCNDNNSLISPGASELCSPPGEDENCNGTIDEGCTQTCNNTNACNYGAMEACVLCDDGYICNGSSSCCSDPDNNMICGDQRVFGCTDPNACNYDPQATHDDGGCVMPLGCDNSRCPGDIGNPPEIDVCGVCGGDGSTCENYYWYVSGWGPCSVSCGGGTQTQTVECRNSQNIVVDDSFCGGIKPSQEQSCNTQACGNTSDSGNNTGSSPGTPPVSSTPPLGNTPPDFPPSNIPSNSPGPSNNPGGLPLGGLLGDDNSTNIVGDNNTSSSYQYQRYVGGWSNCSISCGVGEQRRSVSCLLNGSVVDDIFCSEYEKPNDVRTCVQNNCESGEENNNFPSGNNGESNAYGTDDMGQFLSYEEGDNQSNDTESSVSNNVLSYYGYNNENTSLFVPKDCRGVPNGHFLVDSCGECRDPSDPLFNAGCKDCLGVENGVHVLDQCNQCLVPRDPNFNNCLDCKGVPNGKYRIDQCGQCLDPGDSRFNICVENDRDQEVYYTIYLTEEYVTLLKSCLQDENTEACIKDIAYQSVHNRNEDACVLGVVEGYFDNTRTFRISYVGQGFCKRYVPGSVYVSFRDDKRGSLQIRQLSKRFGIYRIYQPFLLLGLSTFRIDFNPSIHPDTVIRAFEEKFSDNIVGKYTEKIPLFYIMSREQVIPEYLSQIGYDEFRKQCRHLLTGENYEKKRHSVRVAIVDNAFDPDHEDLKDNVWHAYDVADHDNDTRPPKDSPEWYHGNIDAGLVGAVSANGIGIQGIAHDTAQLILIKATSDKTSGHDIDAGIEGLAKASEFHPDILSISWGVPFESNVLESVIKRILRKGIIIVAAAGNFGSPEPFYPAAYDGVISVAAIEKNKKRAKFSNYGSWIDIAAPGVDMLSTALNNQYKSADGTSQAAPLVAGLIAFIKSQGSEIDDLYQSVEKTSEYGLGKGIVSMENRCSMSCKPQYPQLDYNEDGEFTVDDLKYLLVYRKKHMGTDMCPGDNNVCCPLGFVCDLNEDAIFDREDVDILQDILGKKSGKDFCGDRLDNDCDGVVDNDCEESNEHGIAFITTSRLPSWLQRSYKAYLFLGLLLLLITLFFIGKRKNHD